MPSDDSPQQHMIIGDVDSVDQSPTPDDETSIDLATPYSVYNMTGMQISVYTLFDKDSGRKFDVPNEERKWIPVTYETSALKHLSANESGKNDEVKVMFTDHNTLPIENICLNWTGKGIHQIYDEDDESIYWVVQVENMTKVLTLRSTHALINSTNFYYQVRIGVWDKKEPSKFSHVVKELRLRPGQAIAMP